ncbi:MAG TPA: ribulose-phosphate 3-epimerase [bacterium]|nr:ribulose-phosphate 3-epimerase [bacterium]
MSGAFRIAASILSADFAHLGDAVAAAERGGADWIHVDVMDGRFVPEITIGAVIVEAVRSVTRLPVDVHLMIVEPERHVDRFVRAGAASITVHAEATVHLHRLVQQIKDQGVRAGVALNPATPAGVLEPVLDEIEMALLMTVNPGYAGQRFIRSVLPKIRQVAARLAERAGSADLQVDGGINETTAPEVVAAGANVLVAASAIFRGEGGIEASLARLRAAANARRR